MALRVAKKKTAGASWIVTFADLMALLLCLFVLLLSFADMDAKKYKAIAGAMRDAFGTQRITRLTGVVEPEGVSHRSNLKLSIPIPKPMPPEVSDKEPEDDIDTPLRKALKDELSRGDIKVERKGDQYIMRFSGKIAFPSGLESLNTNFRPTLDKLVQVLNKVKGQIIVAGHTDDIPIKTRRFRSNWELSSARAATVVHYLLSTSKINPGQVTAQGFADSRPLVPNDTPENRSRNRRVEIIIMKTKEKK